MADVESSGTNAAVIWSNYWARTYTVQATTTAVSGAQPRVCAVSVRGRIVESRELLNHVVYCVLLFTVRIERDTRVRGWRRRTRIGSPSTQNNNTILNNHEMPVTTGGDGNTETKRIKGRKNHPTPTYRSVISWTCYVKNNNINITFKDDVMITSCVFYHRMSTSAP